MDKMIFNHVIPRIRVFEDRLLDKAKLERMIHTSSAEGAMDILLQEAEFSSFTDHVKRPEDYETLLSLELQRVYNLFYEMSPMKEVVDVMSIKYDYHNLKVLVKAKILEKDFSHMLISVGTVELDTLQNVFASEDYRDLPPLMCRAVEEVFADFEETKDPQRIGILFDRYMFKETLEIAQSVEEPFLLKYVKTQIDLANMETLLRVKSQQKGRDFLQTVLIHDGSIDKDKFIDLLTDSIDNMPRKLFATDYADMLKVAIEDYVKSGSLRLFDKLKDNHLMDMVKSAKVTAFGLEPLIGYLYAKEIEINSIRIIMVGKLNNISAEAVMERLRDTYA